MQYVASVANIFILIFIVLILLENVYSIWLWLAVILWLLFHALKIHLWTVNCQAKQGDTVLLTGASSGIGNFVIEYYTDF